MRVRTSRAAAISAGLGPSSSSSSTRRIITFFLIVTYGQHRISISIGISRRMMSRNRQATSNLLLLHHLFLFLFFPLYALQNLNKFAHTQVPSPSASPDHLHLGPLHPADLPLGAGAAAFSPSSLSDTNRKTPVSDNQRPKRSLTSNV